MMPISRVNTGAAQALEAAKKGMEASKARQSEEEPRGRFTKSVTDEYIPEEKQGPEKKSEKSERCVCNTDKVDREIEKLKKKKKELEQQISTETDESRIKELESQLTQVERELMQKDNDAYRRRHSTYT